MHRLQALASTLLRNINHSLKPGIQILKEPELRDERIAGDGVDLHVVTAGTGLPVILLHGFPEGWRSWRRQIPDLVAAGFSVLAPDMRGYNLSDRPTNQSAYRLDHLVADVAALVKATGYATAGQVTGKIYAADMAAPTGINLTTAVSNMLAAYNDAAGRPFPDFSELGTGNIGGKTLTKGLYKWTSAVTMPSNVTISGSSTDVWIFQISGTLSMSTGVRITLTGGALAKNIFWQVAGQSTLGATSHFEGILMSKQGIAFQTGASINGRALAQTQVTLDNNVVVQPQ